MTYYNPWDDVGPRMVAVNGPAAALVGRRTQVPIHFVMLRVTMPGDPAGRRGEERACGRVTAERLKVFRMFGGLKAFAMGARMALAPRFLQLYVDGQLIDSGRYADASAFKVAQFLVLGPKNCWPSSRPHTP